ncbi:lytic transglycosylase domain-containing protein [Sphingomonas sp.]|jgi:soluble lytic murein transglycosylase-like protein|uniref:lytic transglycosylase domain-containing protein n=1 Tax=Sphingomonas sp. TaxID=28214 RepID=UPI002D7F44FE|nr:lytic transglycosylase domain-containing protein [Sphingomonas sp.]HEU0044662.1 lytic transglycosylase domain-containing protein [Sphingomonas sp.]
MKFATFVALLGATSPLPVLAAEPVAEARLAGTATVPAQLDGTQREGYRSVFAAIRASRWQDAQLLLQTIKPGPLHAIARAELYTAKGSPKVELEPVVQLLTEAPELPQSEALSRLARARGAVELPPLPVTRALIWQAGAPARLRAKATKGDQVAADLALAMQPFVKVDDGASAEALLLATEGLTPEALTEWRQRVAWMYYLSGRDADARRVAAEGAEGVGDWAIQARWVLALTAWRQRDFAVAGTTFEGVAARAGDVDLRAAALYWAARADMAAGRPDKIEARLKTAAQWNESFYGQLSRQALGLRNPAKATGGMIPADWAALDKRPNVRVAAALAEIGETELADRVVRQQARIGEPREFASLVRLTEALDLPATTVWMAHNVPAGSSAAPEARFPMPKWKPDSGWRVDPSLVYAHTLQESGFRHKVISPAGAYGLMQIMPAAATDFARERGLPEVDRAALTRPSVNMDVGQRHLERLRDMTSTTGGLLPKVIAAYNAGAKPVGEWNAIVRDGGDPLLYIESIPYWETRGYVTTVLRNYWVYEAQTGKPKSVSRAALAQGMWPRFPGLPGAPAVRLDARPNTTAVASVAPSSGTD